MNADNTTPRTTMPATHDAEFALDVEIVEGLKCLAQWPNAKSTVERNAVTLGWNREDTQRFLSILHDVQAVMVRHGALPAITI